MRVRTFAMALGLFVTAPLISPAVCLAEGDSPQEAEAEKLDAKVRAEANSGQSSDAYTDALAAYTLAPNLRRLWTLTVIESEVNRPREALRDAHKCLKDPAFAGAKRDEAAKIIGESNALLGHIVIHAPASAYLYIDGSHEDIARGAQVVSDVEIAVPVGSHAVRNGDELPRSVTVEAGRVVMVDLTQPPGGPEAAAAAKAEAEAREARERARRERAAKRAWISGAFGAGAVGLGVTSVILYQLARTSQNDAAQDRSTISVPGSCPNPAEPGCAALSNDLHAQNARVAAGLGTAIGAGALAAGAVISWFTLAPKHNDEHTITLVPMVRPGLGGAVITGTF